MFCGRDKNPSITNMFNVLGIFISVLICVLFHDAVTQSSQIPV